MTPQRRIDGALSPERVMLFLEALAYCSAVRLAVWLVPSRALLRFVHRRVAGVPERRGDDERMAAPSIAWAIRAAGRRVPWSTCLVQALAVQLMLAGHGYGSVLRIGVARDERGEFVAHAWVEVDGRVVVGARRDMQYTALPDLQRTLG